MIELRQHALQLPVGEARRERVDVRVVRGVARVERLLHGGGQQIGGGHVVADGGLGVDIRRLKELARHPAAEAVQGSDLRGVQPIQLPAHARIGERRVTQANLQPFPHLPGGGARERAHKQAIHMRLALPQQRGDALDEHGGLAAAGGGAHQQARIARADGGLLLGRIGHGTPPW